jgi:hypothetical protein
LPAGNPAGLMEIKADAGDEPIFVGTPVNSRFQME